MREVGPMDAALVIISVAGIWWVMVDVAPRLVLDWVRGRLFDIRHRLFLAAADGKIDFDHPGYILLRRQVNAQIRHANQMSLIHIVLLRMALKKHADSDKVLDSNWNQSMTTVTPEQRALLLGFKREVAEAARIRIVYGDWYLSFPLILFAYALYPISRVSVNAQEEKYVHTAQTQALISARQDQMACAAG